MTKKFDTIEKLRDIIIQRNSALEDMPDGYLSEAGSAAREAYRAILWHMSFHGTLESLGEDENFVALQSIPDKHPEYYRIIRLISNYILRK